MAVNLDDTSSCAVGVRYELCGVERDDLRVHDALDRIGVACLTSCPRCAGSGVDAAGVGGHSGPADDAALPAPGHHGRRHGRGPGW